MNGPLKQCCNGCPKPPKAPSWVLCEDCLAKLNAKFERLAESLGKPAHDDQGEPVP